MCKKGLNFPLFQLSISKQVNQYVNQCSLIETTKSTRKLTLRRC